MRTQIHIDTSTITFSSRVSELFLASTSFPLTHEASSIGFFLFSATGSVDSFEDFSTWASFNLSLCILVLLSATVFAAEPANSNSAWVICKEKEGPSKLSTLVGIPLVILLWDVESDIGEKISSFLLNTITMVIVYKKLVEINRINKIQAKF